MEFRHITLAVYLLAVAFSLVSIAILFSGYDRAILIAAISAVANVAAVAQSERGGFVKSNQMRRAYEPPRHFSGLQELSLLAFVMVQVSAGVYVLLT
jgi:hypothetical protein